MQSGVIVEVAPLLSKFASLMDQQEKWDNYSLQSLLIRTAAQLSRACACKEDMCCRIHNTHVELHWGCYPALKRSSEVVIEWDVKLARIKNTTDYWLSNNDNVGYALSLIHTAANIDNYCMCKEEVCCKIHNKHVILHKNCLLR